ncbi:MAG: four helix bundle protein, partial [Nitrospirae bacterium]|nr:four helix bundle protein [Nitrospirota bacterium]
ASFPRSEEATIIKRQLVKAATSVPANIADGYGGNKGKSFQNSSTIARSDSSEADYWIFLCHDIGWVGGEVFMELESGYAEVRAMLTSMIEKLDVSESS